MLFCQRDSIIYEAILSNILQTRKTVCYVRYFSLSRCDGSLVGLLRRRRPLTQRYFFRLSARSPDIFFDRCSLLNIDKLRVHSDEHQLLTYGVVIVLLFRTMLMFGRYYSELLVRDPDHRPVRRPEIRVMVSKVLNVIIYQRFCAFLSISTD